VKEKEEISSMQACSTAQVSTFPGGKAEVHSIPHKAQQYTADAREGRVASVAERKNKLEKVV